MKFADVNELCDLIREMSFEIHRFHRQGHLEKIYENALWYLLMANPHCGGWCYIA
jgi:hypothetical protein